MDRPQIMTRSSRANLDLAEFDQRAESLRLARPSVSLWPFVAADKSSTVQGWSWRAQVCPDTALPREQAPYVRRTSEAETLGLLDNIDPRGLAPFR
jgi:hypothetical protein